MNPSPAKKGVHMSAREFRDNDTGYLAWLATHPDGT